jgi:hypothetical protein
MSRTVEYPTQLQLVNIRHSSLLEASLMVNPFCVPWSLRLPPTTSGLGPWVATRRRILRWLTTGANWLCGR